MAAVEEQFLGRSNCILRNKSDNKVVNPPVAENR